MYAAIRYADTEGTATVTERDKQREREKGRIDVARKNMLTQIWNKWLQKPNNVYNIHTRARTPPRIAISCNLLYFGKQQNARGQSTSDIAT